MFRSCFKKLKTSALFFFALLLSVSSLVNLASFVIEPAFADEINLCRAKNTSDCSIFIITKTDTNGETTNVGNGVNNLIALAKASNYYMRLVDSNLQPVTELTQGQQYILQVADNDNYTSSQTFELGIYTDSDSYKASLIVNGEKATIDNYTPGGSLILPSQVNGLTNSVSLKSDILSAHFSVDDDGKVKVETINTSGEREELEPEVTGEEDADAAGAPATCNTAAGGLGWFLCTVLDGLAKFIQWLYDNAVKPALVIDTKLLVWRDNSGENISGTLSAWSTFRDFANILFVIYLLVVIFSQLTGFGIDNYGIKKTLPKLIAAAILVNLSYIICQLAVDLSNIVGASIYNLLTNISVDIPEKIIDAKGADIVSFTVSPIVTLAVAGAIVGGTIFASGGSLLAAGLGLLIPLTGTIVGAVVGLVFMFFLLGMRQALVVVLVALAPLAIVCYMLPNTKKIFDRWLDILKAMLLLYPICSVVIGGGQLASKIILASGGASGGFFILFTAMIAEIGPFFLVPSLVKGAYRATGELGMRLNRFSGGLGIGARRAFFGSRFARNAQQAAALKRSEAISNNFEKNLRRAANNGTGIRDRASRTLGRLGTGSAAQDATAEARKNLVAAEQARAEKAKWVSGATKDANGNDIVVNGELTTQGNAMIQAQIQQANINAAAQTQNALRYINPTYQQAAAAALARKDIDDNIKANESLIMNSGYHLANTDRNVDPNNQSDLRTALVAALRRDDAESEISALVNVLSSQGDAGRTAVRNAIAEVSDDGSLTESARRAFASNIIQSHANDYKNNSRSVYDFAAANTGENAAQINDLIAGASRRAQFSDYVTQATNSLKQEQLASMDEAELISYRDAVNDQDPSHLNLVRASTYTDRAEAREENTRRIATLRALAYNTLNNPQLSQNLKESQRRIIEEIRGNYVPPSEANAEVDAQEQYLTEEVRNNIQRVDYSSYADASRDVPNLDVDEADYDNVAPTNITSGYTIHPSLRNVKFSATDKKMAIEYGDNGIATGRKQDISTGRVYLPKAQSFGDRDYTGYVPDVAQNQIQNIQWGTGDDAHIVTFEHTPSDATAPITVKFNTRTGESENI